MNELKPGTIIWCDPETGEMRFRDPTPTERFQQRVSGVVSFVWYRIVCPIAALFIKRP